MIDQKIIDDIVKELSIFIHKIGLPVFLSIGFKLAIEMQRNKANISILNFCLSLFIGMVGAFFTYPLIVSNFAEEKVPLVIALTAMLSGKIGEFLIYQFNVEIYLSVIAEGLYAWVTKIFKPK